MIGYWLRQEPARDGSRGFDIAIYDGGGRVGSIPRAEAGSIDRRTPSVMLRGSWVHVAGWLDHMGNPEPSLPFIRWIEGKRDRASGPDREWLNRFLGNVGKACNM